MFAQYRRIENNLFQGGRPDNNMPEDITAILSLQSIEDGEPLHPTFQDRVEMFAWLPILDGPNPGLPWLEAAVGIVEAMIAAGKKVYIHCRGGVSRSVMVTAAYLMKKHFYTRDVALEVIAAENSTIDPAPRFMKLLREYENKLRGKED